MAKTRNFFSTISKRKILQGFAIGIIIASAFRQSVPDALIGIYLSFFVERYMM